MHGIRRTSAWGIARAVLACLPLLLAPSARAWDPETHDAILRTALALSPAAEARLPLEFRDALAEELRSADLTDRICRYHRGRDATKDPAAEAARAFAELKRPQRPYARARAVGRYLHWVADCAVPTPIATGRVFQIKDYWSNIDFLVFRERRALDAASLAASLEGAGGAAQWGDDGPNSYSPVFRLAVNLTIEALLLLPPRPDAAAAVDAGPVIFVVNRQDTGRAATRESLWAIGNEDYLFLAVVRTGEVAPIKRDLMKRRGVQVAEAVSRAGTAGTAVRALLFNNDANAACGVTLRAGKWALDAGAIPAGALLPVAFDLPQGADLGRVKVSWKGGDCGGPAPATVSTARRIVLGATGAPPRFDRGAEVVQMSEPARSSGAGLADTVPAKEAPAKVFAERPAVLPVAFAPAVEPQARALFETRSFQMRPLQKEWQFMLALRNVSDASLGTLELTLEVTPEGKEPPAAFTLTFRGGDVAPNRNADLIATAQAVVPHPASFLVTRLRRVTAAPASRVPAVTNRVAP